MFINRSCALSILPSPNLGACSQPDSQHAWRTTRAHSKVKLILISSFHSHRSAGIVGGKTSTSKNHPISEETQRIPHRYPTIFDDPPPPSAAQQREDLASQSRPRNMTRPPPVATPSGAPIPSLQAATPLEAKTIPLPKQRNMSRPPLPKQRNMTRPSVPLEEQAPAGDFTGAALITAPNEAQKTPAPPKQRNMTRPLLPTLAPAPTMNPQAGAPIHLPVEASASKVLPAQRNMSRPPHPDLPAKEGATDPVADSSIKRRNMTRPPVLEESSTHSSAPLPNTVPPQLEDFDYSWADLNMVRQQCEDFPRNKVSHSYYNFHTDLTSLECSWGEAAPRMAQICAQPTFPV